MSKNPYKKYLTLYGIISLLLVLEYLVQEEKYEECAKIISAINELDFNLPTKLSPELVDEVMEEIWKYVGREGDRGVVMIRDLNYATIILEEQKL